MYGGLGVLMGAPGVPDGQYTPPWHGRSGLRKKMGVIGDFRARGQVFTYVESGYGKLGRFRGMYGCLGGLMGAPRVPDGRSTPPWHG